GDVHHDHGWDQSRQRDERWDAAAGRRRGTSGASERGPQRGYRSDASGGQMTREQAQAIVRSAYQNVLGRDPDPASAGWVDYVYNKHWKQQQVEKDLTTTVDIQRK